MPPRLVSKVSDVALRNAKPKDRPYKLAVGGGLYLEIMPSGSKLWRWKYRLAGKENRLAIGPYPLHSLAQARAEVDAARRLVKNGIHPSHQKQLAKMTQAVEHANNFEAVALEWLAEKSRTLSPRAYVQRKKLLENDVFPHIGAIPARQITPAHVLAILKRVEKRAPAMAVLVNQVVGGISRLAVATLRADIDPTAPLRGALTVRKTKSHTPLSADLLRKFLVAIDDYSGGFHTRAALRLLSLTLARSTELIAASWDEFDLKNAVWVVPAARMKMRDDHVVPLPRQAVELLCQLHAMQPRRAFVFPNRAKPTTPASKGILWKAVNGMSIKDGFSPHAIRATGSTMLNDMGFRADLIEKQLAHEERSKSRRSYNRATYIEERRAMMQEWADLLDGLAAGADVVPLSRRQI